MEDMRNIWQTPYELIDNMILKGRIHNIVYITTLFELDTMYPPDTINKVK